MLPGLVAFSHYTDDNEEAADVYTVHSDGGGLVKLTTNPGNDSEPAWSHDGTRIMFATDRPGTPNTNVWVMNADGSDQHGLTSRRTGASQASWSPDGTSIAFSADGAGAVPAIFVMNAGRQQRSADHGPQQWRHGSGVVA